MATTIIFDAQAYDNPDSFKEYVAEAARNGEPGDYYFEMYGDECTPDDISNQDAHDVARRLREEDYLEATRELTKHLDPRTIVAFGQRNLWDGSHVSGFVAKNTAELINRVMDGGCTHLSIEDVDGRLYFCGHHHDGVNKWEVRLATPEGESYIGDIESGDERASFEHFFSSPDYEARFTDAPRFAEHAYGVKPAAPSLTNAATAYEVADPRQETEQKMTENAAPEKKNVYISLHKAWVQELEDAQGKPYNKVTVPPGVTFDGQDLGQMYFNPLYVNESKYKGEDYRDIPLLADKEVWLKRDIVDEQGNYVKDENGTRQKEIVKVMPADLKTAIADHTRAYAKSKQQSLGDTLARVNAASEKANAERQAGAPQAQQTGAHSISAS